MSYGQPLQSTIQRRIYLRQSKCFNCLCQRCRDPTECDTYIGSLVCSRCRNGKLVSNDPIDETADWICECCSMQMTAGNFQLIQNRLQFAIENLRKQSPYDLEMFLEKYCYRRSSIQQNGSKENGFADVNNEIWLHETNTFVLQIKYALTQLYGNYDGFRWEGELLMRANFIVFMFKFFFFSFLIRRIDLGDTDLSRKIALCKELLSVAEIIEPGQSLFRGKLLIDLQESLSIQTERKLQEQTISVVTAQV